MQSLIEEKLEQEAERAARRGGKALKRDAHKASLKAARPAVEYQEVPTFDKATGELIVQRVRVQPSRDALEAAQLAALHTAPDEPSAKRPKPMQRYEHKDGERTSFFRDDDQHSLQSLVVAERRGAGVAGRIDSNLADSIARSKRFKGLDVDDEYVHQSGP